MTAEAKPENRSLFMGMPIGHFNITVCSFLSLTTSPGNSMDPGLNQLSGPEKRGKKNTLKAHFQQPLRRLSISEWT